MKASTMIRKARLHGDAGSRRVHISSDGKRDESAAFLRSQSESSGIALIELSTKYQNISARPPPLNNSHYSVRTNTLVCIVYIYEILVTKRATVDRLLICMCYSVFGELIYFTVITGLMRGMYFVYLYVPYRVAIVNVNETWPASAEI
jgi:hypothetical protein